MNMFRLGKSYTSFIKIIGKHTRKGLTLFNKKIPLIEQVYNAVNGQLAIAEKLSQMDITTSEGVEFLKKIKENKTLPKKIIETSEQLWTSPIRPEDEERNYWTLFNAITDPLNRKLENKEQVLTFNQIMGVGDIFTELTAAV